MLRHVFYAALPTCVSSPHCSSPALRTKFSFVINRELLYPHLFIKKKMIRAATNLSSIGFDTVVHFTLIFYTK